MLAFLALVFLPLLAVAAPPDFWPLAVPTVSDAVLQQQASKIDAASKALRPELRAAGQFQKTFLKILSGATESAFMPELQRFIAVDGTDYAVSIPSPETDIVSSGTATSHALAEMSRTWLARCEMRQIDGVLRAYYRKHVAFPEQFGAIEPGLPEALRRDPWGAPWVYRTHAPANFTERFAKFGTQRYRLGPKGCPELSTLPEAVGSRNPSAPAWKVTARALGGKKALEFRTKTAVVTIEPGGKVDGFTLLAIASDWALMAGADQLFTLAF